MSIHKSNNPFIIQSVTPTQNKLPRKQMFANEQLINKPLLDLFGIEHWEQCCRFINTKIRSLKHKRLVNQGRGT